LGHFVDSYRQAGIDIMQGQTISDEDVENCSSELQTAISIAQALVPLSAPMYMSDIALGPEMKFVSALYHMTRCVSTMIFASCCLVYVQHFISFNYQSLLCF
jgi:small neutral amino acid transporter SnatA (MarC family)